MPTQNIQTWNKVCSGPVKLRRYIPANILKYIAVAFDLKKQPLGFVLCGLGFVFCAVAIGLIAYLLFAVPSFSWQNYTAKST